MLYYVTADRVGLNTGGGKVTEEEYDALSSLGQVGLISRDELEEQQPRQHWTTKDPWLWDEIGTTLIPLDRDVRLAHFYSGTFSHTVEKFKNLGAKVAYTIAAHDVAISKREHEKLGFQFTYPHLLDPELWAQYIRGYQEADLIVCPSTVAANTVQKYGDCDNIVVIPHGTYIPEKIPTFPKTFVVGYLGSCAAPDKGLIYLLQAWKKLNYSDAILMLGGSDSNSSYMLRMCTQFGGGNINLQGWIPFLEDFYSAISLYVQPSTTEGFGLEVLEAMAYGRPVLCSKNAGAADIIPSDELKFEACNVDDLAEHIDNARKHWDLADVGKSAREIAENHSWDKIRQRYVYVWNSLLQN